MAATPAAPPRHLRPARLAEKVAAGAELCFINHCGGPKVVASFVEAARAAGADIDYVACVAVTTDRYSLASLAALPGTAIDDAAVAEAATETAVDAMKIAVGAAREMMGVPGVTGINLSGSASSGSDIASAEIMAAIGTAVRSDPASGPTVNRPQ